MNYIRANRYSFETSVKGTKANGSPDIFTNADVGAQQIYLKCLKSSFPGYGIVAEESELSIPCTLPGKNLWFSVDPLDGTSAFERKQSQGIGTMLALMEDNHVLAVYVGDVMTGEVYSYIQPDGPPIRFENDPGTDIQQLEIDEYKPLFRQHLLLRAPVAKLSPLAQRLATHGKEKLFKSHEIANGSIGISTARLWKGEVGGVILYPGKQTPWDTCPLIGMNKRLGFFTFNITSETRHSSTPGFDLVDPKPSMETYQYPLEQLVIHKTRLAEFAEWCAQNNLSLEAF